jgi:hypothetical protein
MPVLNPERIGVIRVGYSIGDLVTDRENWSGVNVSRGVILSTLETGTGPGASELATRLRRDWPPGAAFVSAIHPGCVFAVCRLDKNTYQKLSKRTD